MNYWTSHITDVGTYRKNNQDALLLKIAKTSSETVLLSAIADGVGGLKCGELASNTMIHDLAIWFEKELPVLIKTSNCLEDVKRALLRVIQDTHVKLYDYMEKNKIKLGTTVALLFIFRNEYVIIHVGDTRVYLYNMCNIHQLTKDHTYVQREIDAGRMKKEEAEFSGRDHILTQCIGFSPRMIPDVQTGTVNELDVFLICSDGFRNSLTNVELKKILEKVGSCEKDIFEKVPQDTVELIKERGERDNISALFIKCF